MLWVQLGQHGYLTSQLRITVTKHWDGIMQSGLTKMEDLNTTVNMHLWINQLNLFQIWISFFYLQDDLITVYLSPGYLSLFLSGLSGIGLESANELKALLLAQIWTHTLKHERQDLNHWTITISNNYHYDFFLFKPSHFNCISWLTYRQLPVLFAKLIEPYVGNTYGNKIFKQLWAHFGEKFHECIKTLHILPH